MRASLPVVVVLAITAAPATAELCAPDAPPAATLLLPYFEVALDSPVGQTTLFSINNSSSAPVLAHVVLWTDHAVPTLGFDVYLTGFDVETLNLRDVLAGHLPPWGGGDPPGGLSDPNADVPECPPAPPAPLLGARLAALHSGGFWPPQAGICAGANHGDGVARGYVTVDVATRCSALLPGDAGYFGPGGVAGFANVLWGDFAFVDAAGNYAQGGNLVRIEARPGGLTAGDRTFYRDLVDGTAADAREALPVVWATRFLNTGAFDGGSDLLLWRGGPRGGTFPCGAPPTVRPLERSLLVFDEEENVQALPLWPSRFPLATNRVAVGAELPLPFDFGWLLLDLATSVSDPGSRPQDQAWLQVVMSAEGRYSIGTDGTPLTAGCVPGGCLRGEHFPGVTRLCVLSSSPLSPFELLPGQPATVTVLASGGFGSTCTFVHEATCGASLEGSLIDVESRFCLERTSFEDCTPDSGAPSKACLTPPLEAGTYEVRAGELRIEFTVPLKLPFPTGGLCVTSHD